MIKTPTEIQHMAHEIRRVLINLQRGTGYIIDEDFETLSDIAEQLYTQAEAVRMVLSSEREGWRYSDELDKERIRLQKIVDEHEWTEP